MGKYIRIFTAIIVVLALVLLAKNKAAWAADPAAGSNQSPLAQAEQSVSPGRDDDCDKDKDKNKDKDKDKDKCCGKDKDKCDDDDDDDDDGTVKPPDDDIKICERGDYSVGGVATLDVKKLRDREEDRKRDRDCFKAHTESADTVSGIPGSAGTVLSAVVVLQSFGEGSHAKICFAVPPDKQVKIYFSGQGGWKALKTPVKQGVACAQVPRSGSYTLVGL